MTVRPPQSGFADPVVEAQAVFHAVMMTLARPGTIASLATSVLPPAPLTPALAAVALALCDHETLIWLDEALSASLEPAAFLRFHTGAGIVDDPAEAAFALVSDAAALPPLTRFAQGTDEYPDRSTTIVIAVGGLTNESGFSLEGPGIKGRAALGVDGLPSRFADELAENRAQFPRGVDFVFVTDSKVAALPRSTRVEEA